MVTLNDVIEQNINLSTNVVSKLNVGFVFDNKDYCKLYSINVLRHIIKNLNDLDLSNEIKEKILTLYNNVLNNN